MTTKRTRINLKTSLGLFLFSACMGSVEVTEVSCGSFDPDESCSTCSGQSIFWCVCELSSSIEVVHDEVYPCQGGTHCGLCPGGALATSEKSQPCPGETPVPTSGFESVCESWDPGYWISTISTNEFSVDSGFVSMVQSDPTPLYQCDSARVNVESGNLIVQDAVSTDAAYLLGFRNGDQFVAVNGMSLAGPIDAVKAYVKLWLEDGETEYSITVLRSSSPVTLSYSLYAASP